MPISQRVAMIAIVALVSLGALAAAPTGPIEVEEKGKWYPAEVMKQDGEKTCIHYKGWAAKYDECVPANRIRPAVADDLSWRARPGRRGSAPQFKGRSQVSGWR